MNNIYEYNETMKMIGEQNAITGLIDDSEKQMIQDVIDAHKNYPEDSNTEILDYLTLGYILGKRAERKN